MVKGICKKLIFPLNLALQAAFSLYEIVKKQNSSRKGPTPTCFTEQNSGFALKILIECCNNVLMAELRRLLRFGAVKNDK